jgi:hypothetical protein
MTTLSCVLPSIGFTRRTLKRLQSIDLVREERDSSCQELAYTSRPFVLCGIPLRRPPVHQTIHTRRNGNLWLEIIGHPWYGLPFGQDRLILIWITTLVVLQKTRTVRFNSASQLLEYFELPKNGHHYRRMIDGFQRIFAATILFGTEEQRERAKISELARFHFFDRVQLLYDRERVAEPRLEPKSTNVITLSEFFYEEVSRHRIPAERRVLAALANAPGRLDFYMWLVWRTWTLHSEKTSSIPLYGPNGLVHQLGTAEYARDRRFKEKLGEWLREVKAWWPACPASISDNGRALVITSAKHSPAIKNVRQALPAVPLFRALNRPR